MYTSPISIITDSFLHTETMDDFPLLSISTPKVLSLCADLRDDANLPTVFVASFPKSGTTWMQAIVYNLLSNGDQSFDHISNYSPFFEISRTWDEENNRLNSFFHDNHQRLGARVFNTHLRYNMMPKGDKMKYIYVCRSGKDAALSFYHHLHNQDDADNYGGSLSDFLRDWLNGKIIFGSWLRHLENWIPASLNPMNNILVVKYEDLVQDLVGEMVRIAAFLDLSYSRTEIEKISKYVTFDYMKSHSRQFSPTSVPWKTGFEFIRQGVVGQSEAAFTAADHAAFEEMISSIYPEGLPIWLTELNIV